MTVMPLKFRRLFRVIHFLRRVDGLRYVVCRQNLRRLRIDFRKRRLLRLNGPLPDNLRPTSIPGPNNGDVREGRARAQAHALSQNATGLAMLLGDLEKCGVAGEVGASSPHVPHSGARPRGNHVR